MTSKTASKRKSFKTGLMKLANLSMQSHLAWLTEGFVRTRHYGDARFARVYRTVAVIEEIIATRETELKSRWFGRLMVNGCLGLRLEAAGEKEAGREVERGEGLVEGGGRGRSVEEEVLAMVVRNNVKWS